MNLYMETNNNNTNKTINTEELPEILKHTKITKAEMENAKEKIISEAKYLKIHTERSKNTRHIHTNLYWLLIKPFTYLNAYGNLSRNKGATTPGIDGKSISGFSWEECKKLAEKIKTQTFEPTPVKRIWINKPGKKEKRPLGIPTIQDRIVQEAIRGILEAIYEPIFQETYKEAKRKVENFGFRPNLGCWDAIERIVNMGQGINQVIEGDIKGAYDNVDHEILLKLLNTRIKDKKTIEPNKKIPKSRNYG
jgi:retron-type reverse transcriptase